MEYFLVAFIGACLGSFVTAASYRLPRDEDIVFEKSRCPSCNNALGPRDLVPVLSYLWNRAKCSMCKTRISPRYVATELVMAGLAVALFWHYGLGLQFALLLVLSTFLMISIVADFETYIMPDTATIGAFVVGIAYVYLFEANWLDNIAGLVTGLVIGVALRYGYQMLMKKEGLGMGDVKFLPVAGLWVGLTVMPVYLVLAGLLGVLTAIIWRIIYKNPVFPFGPALALGVLITCVFKDTFLTFMQP